MARDLFVDQLDNLAFDELNDFLGLQNRVGSRPAEGTVLDYKVSDGGDWPEAVAAFGAGMGGQLISLSEIDLTQPTINDLQAIAD